MTKKTKYILVLFFIYISCISIVYASGNKYDVKNIPQYLLKDADDVVRVHTINFEVEDNSSAVLKEKIAVTVLDKDGQDFGRLVLWYDKFREIDDLDGEIYDESGEEVRDLDGDDIKDYSAVSGYTLYEDTRVKVAELYYDKYPYTVEFTYEIDYDGYISWPSWYSRTTIEPIESTKFIVKVPDNYKLRYWCNKDTTVPQISDGGRVYTWEAKNLNHLSYDVVGDDIEDVATIVKIAPGDFEIDGLEGKMNTWKEFGTWIYKLFKGRDVLPKKAVVEIDSLILPLKNVRQKVFKLYKYMQARTRYVSIQLGLGAWRPYDATYVYEHGYGDCKALSNFMVSILKTAGIGAFPVLINNGDERLPLIKKFPSNQFNHVIVCVPIKNDTIWLECTNQDITPGNIGWSNENRRALIITPTGGVVVKTPKSSAHQNLELKQLNVKLYEIKAEVSGNIKWKDNQQNSVLSVMKNNSPDDQVKWILNSFAVPDIKLKSYDFSQHQKNKNEIDLNLKISLPRYVTFAGERIFFNPNLNDRRTYVPAKVEERLSPVRFSYPYHDLDSIYFSIPLGYKVEALPDEEQLSSSFGKFFSKTISLSAEKILYVRSLEIEDYNIPANNYNEYRKFFENIVKADRAQVVLIKKSSF